MPAPAPAAAPIYGGYDDVDWSEDEHDRGGGEDPVVVPSFPSAPALSKDVVDSAISTASHMTDWAGRAVQRAFKLHLQQTGAEELPRPATGEPKLSSSSSSSSSSSASWTCTACTFVNGAGDACELCRSSRAAEARTAVDQACGSHPGCSSGGSPPPAKSSGVRAPAAEDEEPLFVSRNQAFFDGDRPLPAALDLEEDEENEEEEAARDARRTAMRDADKLTDTMKEEVMELLRAFGLPYMVAPFEAEAQCAVLQELGLVDGVVTEDSDAFLFGAATVYKNIFNDRKFVEVYRMQDVQRELGLSREELIGLAFFLGSDYCEGVSGVGIVNAAEIVQAFPMALAAGGALGGMRNFKRWLEGYSFEETLRDKKLAARGAAGRLAKRRREGEGEGDSDSEEGAGDDAALAAFDAKHRTGRAKWKVPGGFPDEKVYSAYKAPAANRSTDAFEFPVPKLHRVRAYCRDQLGWVDGEMDSSIDPVIARFAERSLQTRIDGHFVMQYDDDKKVAQIQSQRLRKAVQEKVGQARVGGGKKARRARTLGDEEEEPLL